MTAEHIPTDDKRNLVTICSGMGMPHEKIAKMIGISASCMRVHYGEELEAGKSKVDAMVYSKLMDNVNKGNVPSIIFYLKARCGWRETSVVEVEGLPPVVFNVRFGDDPPAPLPESERKKLEEHKPTVIDHAPAGN